MDLRRFFQDQPYTEKITGTSFLGNDNSKNIMYVVVVYGDKPKEGFVLVNIDEEQCRWLNN